MWQLQVTFLVALIAMTYADDQPFRNFVGKLNLGCNRTICSQLNPDVRSNYTTNDSKYNQLPNLLYFQGSLVSPVNNVSDTLHVLFTTYGGYPTVMFVHCNTSSDPLIFDWDILLSTNSSVSKFGGIKPPASCKNCYSFALLAVSAIDFNDTSNSATLDETSVTGINVIPLDKLPWSQIVNDPALPFVRTNPLLDNGTYFSNNGSLMFQFAYNGISGTRAADLPQLQFTGNSVQLSTILDNWATQFSNSRLGLELVFVADVVTTQVNADAQNDAKMYLTQSIDDEYTPGTFTIVDWVTRGSLFDEMQSSSTNVLNIPNGYLQYKPIAYSKPEFTVENTVNVGYTSLKTDVSMISASQRIKVALERSIIAAYYNSVGLATAEGVGAGDCPLKYTLSAVNVTFGQVDDGFYKKTLWTRWTSQIGFGVPPQDAVSFLVIMVILAGLGIPIVLMAIGGIYLCIRKRNSDSVYDRIN